MSILQYSFSQEPPILCVFLEPVSGPQIAYIHALSNCVTGSVELSVLVTRVGGRVAAAMAAPMVASMLSAISITAESIVKNSSFDLVGCATAST